MSVTMSIKVGSRKSELALIQTRHVVKLLKNAHPNLECEIITMSTTGDNILDTALSKIGEKALFTKELELALEDKTVDLVVHSLKDLPTVLPDGMVIGSVLERDDPHDAVVLHPEHKGKSLDTLPKDSVVGTSSLRRAAQLKRKYPDLQFESVRGNLNTRLRKLDEADNYAALILAASGLARMGWQERIEQTLTGDTCLYAVSQGALAVEVREGDEDILALLEPLTHTQTLLTVLAERAFLKTLEGGCTVPVGIYSTLEGNKLTLKGGVYNLDGSEAVEDSESATLPDPDETSEKKRAGLVYSGITCSYVRQASMEEADNLGVRLAQKLISQGAGKILTVVKEHARNEILKAKQAKLDAIKEANKDVANRTQEVNGTKEVNGS